MTNTPHRQGRFNRGMPNVLTRSAALLSRIVEGDAPTKRSRTVPVVFFALTICLYIAYLSARQPHWLFGGEMWAEMATNYYDRAWSEPLWKSVFGVDFGYLSFPLRGLAIATRLFHLPASAVPYFFTFSAVLGTAALVGIFCLSDFRELCESDALRFLAICAILIVADFETRTFINFFYYGALTIAYFTALAWVRGHRDVPRYAWLIPLLIVSKPVVLVTLPAMVIVSLVGGRRFRMITLVSVCLGALQCGAMLLNRSVLATVESRPGLGPTAWIVVRDILALTGEFVLGPRFDLSNRSIIVAGSLLLFAGAWVARILRRRGHGSPEFALFFVAAWLVVSNTVLHAFTTGSIWLEMGIWNHGPLINRHIAVGFGAAVLSIAAMAAWAARTMRSRVDRGRHIHFESIVFATWFVLSGWLSNGWIWTTDMTSPMVDNSRWQQRAALIDHSQAVVCVPVDPFGWVYGRHCAKLNSGTDWQTTIAASFAAPYSAAGGSRRIELPLDALPVGAQLHAFAVLVRPLDGIGGLLAANGELVLADGGLRAFASSVELPPTGGLVAIDFDKGIDVKSIVRVSLLFDRPMRVAGMAYDRHPVIAVLWMGDTSQANLPRGDDLVPAGHVKSPVEAPSL